MKSSHPLKILCVIDHFGSGGAQRQMVHLACGLKARGHQVEMFIYFPVFDFFRQQVDDAGITVHAFNKKGGFSFKLLWRLVKLLKSERYDTVISFLGSPNIYSELACLAYPKTRLIVSERSSHYDDKSKITAFIKRLLHTTAQYIATNNYTHAEWLRQYFWIKNKVVTIYNGIQLGAVETLVPPASPSDLKLIVVGRVGPEKNALRLIEALSIFHLRHGYCPTLTWVGKRDTRATGIDYWEKIEMLLNKYPEVKSNWIWMGERKDIFSLYNQHHAVVHPSLYEGLPNVICEALATGRPVLASNVCDHPLLVKNGERGFLFDPYDPRSIADAIEKLSYLTSQNWKSFSENARYYAEENLTMARMVEAYEAVIMTDHETLQQP